MEKIYGDLVQFTEFVPSLDLAFHHYLLMGDEAILIHTGTLNYSKELIPKLKEVLDGKNLKYIYVSHFESDECGGLSEILKAYPDSKVICSETTSRQLMGFGITFNVVVKNGGEFIEENGYKLRFLKYPSEMHLWDGLLMYEENRNVLFSSDLFFGFGKIHGEVRCGNWEEELKNSGAFQISQELVAEISKLSPKFIATGHGQCIEIKY